LTVERVEAYAQALLDIVKAEGHLTEVEDELFRFSRIIAGNDELRMALANPGMPVDRRAAIVDELLEGRTLALTRAIAAFIVGAGRGHDFPAIVQRFVELSASSRDKVVAEVRTATPLDDASTQKLADALSRATGKQVEVKVAVDPSVMGGLVVEMGDTVMDGTVRHRLEQLKEML
jgi:F-type H+-transporting ATPase subunit delta